MANRLIVIEGIDGVGKSTIARELARKLNAVGIRTIAIYAPTGGYKLSMPYVNRRCDVNSHYLFYLSGVKHTSDRIRQLLGKYTVVCDRYIYATEAYHKANPELHVSVDLKQLAILEPDFKFYLYVSNEAVRRGRLSQRKKKHPGDEQVRSQNSTLSRIEEEYKKFDLVWIDTTYLSIEDVVSEILGKVK